jgi:rod shape-determining protein MreD
MNRTRETIIPLVIGLGLAIIQQGIINRADGIIAINIVLVAVIVYLANRRILPALVLTIAAGYFIDWQAGSYWPIHVVGLVISGAIFLFVYRRLFVSETWISLVTSAVIANLSYAIYITIYTTVKNGNISPDQWTRISWSYASQLVITAVIMYFVYRLKRRNLFTVNT